MWNFNHWKFKMLSKNWHWNLSKTVSQLIVINFRKLLLNHRFPASEFYTLYVFHLSFFFVYWILMYFFFSLFCNTSNYWNPEVQNFPVSTEILINQTVSTFLWKTEEPILEWKTEWRNYKDTIEMMYKNLYRSNTQTWTQY